MKRLIYAMEQGFLAQLLDDRRELLAVARSLGTAEAMAAARDELIRSATVFTTPATPDETAKSYTVDADGVAHIPIVGELTPRAKVDACGAYTADALTEYGFIIAASRAADADERVSAIRYEVNSPGGYFEGVMEAANAIRSVGKPTEAVVGSMAASAAYWLASQTDKIVASSVASRVGSIGVAVEEYDDSEMLQKAGISKRIYTSTDAPDKRPDTKTEEGRAKVVAQLDDVHAVFVGAVAEGRGTTAKHISEAYGRGGVLIAEKALAAGMIDEVRTFSRADAREVLENPGVAGNNTAAKAEEKETQEGVMDIKTLQTEHPEVFAEAVKIGVLQERVRVADLRSYAEADSDNPKLIALVGEAIAGGAAVSEITARLQVAIRDGKKLDGENPPDVKTMADEDPLTADDIEAAKLAGMDLAEYRKYSKEVM